MKLRAITLNNVRRFTAPVTLANIGDGLNVLSEPNEHGKSTLFDAIHALFFKAYGANDKEIKALKPHAGGAPDPVGPRSDPRERHARADGPRNVAYSREFQTVSLAKLVQHQVRIVPDFLVRLCMKNGGALVHQQHRRRKHRKHRHRNKSL